jgi:probable addiction module antidote protein
MQTLSIADALDTDERIAAYWDEVVSEIAARPHLVAVALGEIAHARIVNQLADEAGMTSADLWEAVSGNSALPIEVV